MQRALESKADKEELAHQVAALRGSTVPAPPAARAGGRGAPGPPRRPAPARRRGRRPPPARPGAALLGSTVRSRMG